MDSEDVDVMRFILADNLPVWKNEAVGDDEAAGFKLFFEFCS